MKKTTFTYENYEFTVADNGEEFFLESSQNLLMALKDPKFQKALDAVEAFMNKRRNNN